MKAKNAGERERGIRAVTATLERRTNKDSLTGSPRWIVAGEALAFDRDDYWAVVDKDIVIYNDYVVDQTMAAIETLSRILGNGVRKVILDYVEARDTTARSTTTDRANAKLRLKWEKDRRKGENPAQFAWRAYAVEAAAGTLHRGLIYKENRELHRRLNSWLRSHPMPEGIDIPTKPEWNTRLLAKFDRPLRPRVSGEEGRLYNVARLRRRKRGAPA